MVKKRKRGDRKLLVWEQNWLGEYGWTREKIERWQAKGEATPVEYLVGEAEFCGLRLKVTPEVLIPRVETEELVGLVMDALKSQATVRGILEVGTGSGAIAVALGKSAQARKRDLKIWAVDVSAAAVAVARENVKRHQVAVTVERVGIKGLEEWWLSMSNGRLITKSNGREEVQGDKGTTIKEWWLVANLPYIPSSEIAALDESVKDFEPRLALDGGKDGLAVIRELLKWVGQLQRPPGKIFLELDPSQTVSQLKQALPTYQWQRFKDQNGYWRFGGGTLG